MMDAEGEGQKRECRRRGFDPRGHALCEVGEKLTETESYLP